MDKRNLLSENLIKYFSKMKKGDNFKPIKISKWIFNY